MLAARCSTEIGDTGLPITSDESGQPGGEVSPASRIPGMAYLPGTRSWRQLARQKLSRFLHAVDGTNVDIHEIIKEDPIVGENIQDVQAGGAGDGAGNGALDRRGGRCCDSCTDISRP